MSMTFEGNRVAIMAAQDEEVAAREHQRRRLAEERAAKRQADQTRRAEFRAVWNEQFLLRARTLNICKSTRSSAQSVINNVHAELRPGIRENPDAVSAADMCAAILAHYKGIPSKLWTAAFAGHMQSILQANIIAAQHGLVPEVLWNTAFGSSYEWDLDEMQHFVKTIVTQHAALHRSYGW